MNNVININDKDVTNVIALEDFYLYSEDSTIISKYKIDNRLMVKKGEIWMVSPTDSPSEDKRGTKSLIYQKVDGKIVNYFLVDSSRVNTSFSKIVR